MDKEQALREIKERVSEMLGLNAAEIADDALLIEDLGASSIEVVQLYVHFQEQGIALADSFDLFEPVSIESIAQRVVEVSNKLVEQ